MSLILEALRKLDREKEAPERGFVVVASEPWPAPRRNRARTGAVALLGLLAVAAVLFSYNRTRAVPVAIPVPLPTPNPVRTIEPTPASPPVAVTTLLAAPAPRPTAAPLAASAGAPPAPRGPAMASPPSLVLQAISERDGKPIALLSDRLVREGDEFDGVRVIRIGEAEVEVEWHGQRSVVRF